jgi:phthiodiolone/phenolphthiodiolone dimycocerosates ketoreductase
MEPFGRYTDVIRSSGGVMKVQPAAFLRTTLPLDLSKLDVLDGGRYHSIWLPDHMVSFWPESIWSPEFTDLATVSASPHRHLDAMAVAAAAAVLTKNVPIATSVVDTVRRHPSLLAQSALTIHHLSRGRFILGLGCGETENTVPYGFDFAKPVARYEEALRVIKMLWAGDGPVDFSGQFYTLRHARLDTEPYEGACSASSAGIATVGGRPGHIRPTTMQRSSRRYATRQSRPAATPWPSPLPSSGPA